MKETTKQSIAIFVITLLLAATIFVVNSFTLKAYHNYQKARIKTQENIEVLSEIENYKKLANELTAKYQAIGGDFAKIRMALPSEPQFGNLVGTIDAIARLANVSVSSMTFREIETATSPREGVLDYSMVEINLVTAGQYEAIVDFFEKIELELRLMDVASVNIKQAPQARGVQSGIIEANVIINAYFQKTK